MKNSRKYRLLFQLQQPFLRPDLRGTEEMSTASTYFKAVNEMADMALLELTATPPVYYRPLLRGLERTRGGTCPLYVHPTSPILGKANQYIR